VEAGRVLLRKKKGMQIVERPKPTILRIKSEKVPRSKRRHNGIMMFKAIAKRDDLHERIVDGMAYSRVGVR
jgi:hypothetical protein